MKHKLYSMMVLSMLLTVCGGCSSTDSEPWNEDWDKSLTDIPNADDVMSIGPAEEIEPSGVAISGKIEVLDEALAKELRAEAAEKARNPLDIHVDAPGQVKKKIGKKALSIDSLTVFGPINAEDLTYITRCSAVGKLRKLNLEKAQLENNTMPVNSFLCTDFVYVFDSGFSAFVPSYIPIYTLVLPENLEKLGRYSLNNLLITHIELPATLKYIGNRAFKHTVLLGGELSLNESIETIESGAFFNAGNALTVNYNRRTVPSMAFEGAGIKEFILAEGVVEVLEPYALQQIRDMESITLPKSLKKVGVCALADLPQLKSIYCLFEDPSIVPLCTDEEIMSGETKYAWCDFENPGANPTPRDVTVYVPKGCRQSFASSYGWEWFSKFVEME